ncbi:5-oxoprolinase subunit PxpB [Marinobacter hydrocarbonoclasticus]|nr:5-oxoprolinase subunit PxpB [Marinobacter nauticus]
MEKTLEQAFPDYRMSPLGDSAVLITTESDTGLDWVALGESVRALDGITDVIPAYHSLTLHWDHRMIAPEASIRPVLEQAMVQQLNSKGQSTNRGKRVELPVCYHPSLAPDLNTVAHHAGLSVEEVIQRHSVPEYQVRFLGFAPGFPFLSGLDPALSIPRHATPRLEVAAGSVGIAGNQTGIYPNQSPGGWQLIGRCPLPLVDFEKAPPTRLQPGDTLIFTPISLAEFERLSKESS